MELSEIIPHIEALIFASDKPLNIDEIAELINNAFGFLEERITSEQVQTALEGIQEKYNADFYPFEVKESGGGWQFLSKPAFYKTIVQLNGEKFLKRLSTCCHGNTCYYCLPAAGYKRRNRNYSWCKQ